MKLIHMLAQGSASIVFLVGFICLLVSGWDLLTALRSIHPIIDGLIGVIGSFCLIEAGVFMWKMPNQ